LRGYHVPKTWWIHTYSQIFTSLVTPLPFQGLFHSVPCSDAIQEASGKCRPRIVCLHGCFQSCGPQVMGNGWTCYGNGFCMFLLILLPIYPDRSIWSSAKMLQWPVRLEALASDPYQESFELLMVESLSR
jgi:hypothetical protein